MRDVLNSRFQMFKNVYTNFYLPIEAFFLQYLGIKSLFEELKDKIDEIEAVNIKQSQTSKGITVEKHNRKVTLCQDVYTIATAAVNVVLATPDQELYVLINKKEYEFYAMKSGDLVTASRLIYNKTLPLLAQLQPFGITQQDFTELDASINAFDEYQNKPHAKIEDRSTDSDYQSELIWECSEFLDTKLDSAMGIFKKKSKGKYYDYKVQRRLVEPGVTRHEGLEVFVKENVHKIPIIDASTEVPNEYIDQQKLTDKEGRAYYDLIIEGFYYLTITKEGYISQTIKVEIKKDQRTTITVLLVKI
jgi:hypothetical protein